MFLVIGKIKCIFVCSVFGVIISHGWWMVKLTQCTFLTPIVLIPCDHSEHWLSVHFTPQIPLMDTVCASNE